MLRTTLSRRSPSPFTSSFIHQRTFTSTSRACKVIPEAIQTEPGKRPEAAEMDGDATAKTMDDSANKTMTALDQTEGMPETATQRAPAGEKTTGTGTPAFSKDGAIGKQFNADGAIGGTANSVGGPFAADGMIGKHFNADGAIGGTVQKNVGNKEP